MVSALFDDTTEFTEKGVTPRPRQRSGSNFDRPRRQNIRAEADLRAVVRWTRLTRLRWHRLDTVRPD